MIILLPPSEGKSSLDGAGSFRANHPELMEGVEGVLARLKRLTSAERVAWYGQKDALKANEIHQRNLGVPDSPCVPAIKRYTGVVYGHIGPATLARPKTAVKRLVIVSALFGAIRADTAIPPYKLPMNATLARYWRTINGERISSFAKKSPVLSLLPQSYAKAVEIPEAITVDFKLAGGKRSAGHFGKAIKGRFVRYLLQNRIDTVDGFEGFDEDGYRFDGKDFVQA